MISKLEKWAVFFMALFASLTALDSVTTYLGISHLGLIEGDPNTKARIESMGLAMGIIATALVNSTAVVLTALFLFIPMRIYPHLRNRFRSDLQYERYRLVVLSARIFAFMLLVGLCFYLLPTIINNYGLIFLGVGFFHDGAANIASLIAGGVLALLISILTGEVTRS